MITIAFTTKDSWVSRLIKWATRGSASHVLIGTKVYGVDMFLHCSVGGVQMSTRDKWLKKNKLVHEYKVMPNVRSGLQHAFSHLNEKYDYLALLGYAWIILAWRLLKVKWKNPLASSKGMVCSEFVRHLDLNGDRITEWKDLDPERTHPKHLMDICESSSNFEEIK